MTVCWVLLADAGRARILRAEMPLAELEEVEDLVEPSARQPGREIDRDAPGRAMDRGGGQRHALAPRQEPREQVANGFARLLAQRLAEGQRKEHFMRLYLVAPPAFLGQLRAVLDPGLRACVAGEIGKDITRLPLAEVRGYLPKRL